MGHPALQKRASMPIYPFMGTMRGSRTARPRGRTALAGGLRAFNVGEERELAGRAAGALYLTGALTASLIPFLPGTTTSHRAGIATIAGLSALWGIACFTVVPWQRVPALVSHLSTGMGFPIAALLVAWTGGAHSPAKLYLLFIVVYAAYFYAVREAVPYIVGSVVVTALPVLYDPTAVEHGFVAELAIIGPSYLLLGGMISAGKRVMIDLREQAQELSLHDSLTGLPNRRALIERLEERVGAGPVALLLTDLDGFKDANTMYGHPVGDEVLRQTADALVRATREDDLVARLGGDEFAIVVSTPNAQTLGALSERVLAEVRTAGDTLELPDLHVTASAGWAMYPADAESVEDLMAAADLALRSSKVSGKDRVSSPLDWAPADSLDPLTA